MHQLRIMIIGASSGIGRKLAELYAAENAMVGITARRKELLEEIKNQYPEHIEYECFDVMIPGFDHHMESLVKKLGGLDVLIISAGVGEPAKELSWAIDKRTVDTNINGFLASANWGFNYFLKQGHGHLVNISSIAAARGGSHAPAYNASKAFQSNYFEGLSIKAIRLKTPITVLSVEPGFVDTKMSKSETIFWLVPLEKAARQIKRAIKRKKRKIYVSRRWWIIAKLMKWAPFWIYRRFG